MDCDNVISSVAPDPAARCSGELQPHAGSLVASRLARRQPPLEEEDRRSTCGGVHWITRSYRNDGGNTASTCAWKAPAKVSEELISTAMPCGHRHIRRQQ